MELPQETLTLEGFEAWDRRRRAPEHRENRPLFVSIRADGTICISKAAYEMFGSPEAVQLMFDPKLRRIGLKPVERDTGEASAGDSSYYLLGAGQLMPCKAFCEYYGVPLNETRRYTPKLVDGTLIIDL